MPVYLLFVRQMMSNKDAAIEALREQNKSLERERLPIVIQEKQTLTEDIAVRAKEKAETDKALEQMSDTIRQVSESLRGNAENLGSVTGKANELAERLKGSKRHDQSVGLLLGAKMLQESYVEWRLLFTKLPGLPGTSEFDAYLRGRLESIAAVINRVRTSGGFVKMEELALDPQVQEKMVEISKAKSPAGVKTA